MEINEEQINKALAALLHPETGTCRPDDYKIFSDLVKMRGFENPTYSQFVKNILESNSEFAVDVAGLACDIDEDLDDITPKIEALNELFILDPRHVVKALNDNVDLASIQSTIDELQTADDSHEDQKIIKKQTPNLNLNSNSTLLNPNTDVGFCSGFTGMFSKPKVVKVEEVRDTDAAKEKTSGGCTIL